jgi:hypothetical protein
MRNKGEDKMLGSIRSLLSKVYAPVLVIIFAAGWAAYILWPTALDIGNTHWLWGDLAQVYIAWKQYLNDPDAHWLSSNRLSYPLPMNFALFDSMPVFLLLVKPFAWLLPKGFQFFGWYFFLCVVLQAVFGYLATIQALRLVTANHQQRIVYLGIIGGCLIGAMPFTFNRFEGHTALSSQWVLVLSIYTILRTLDFQRKYWLLANCAVVLLAAGINPYLALMVLLSDMAVATLCFWRLGWVEICVRNAALVVAMVVGFHLFGFAGAAGVDIIGYGKFSMNALGPIDSNGLARIFSIDIPDPVDGQTFEGYDYLGAGVLVLCASSLLLFINYRAPANKFPFGAALTVIVLCYALALSTTPTVASYKGHLDVPLLVEYMLGRFRCSGRLFWISGFWIVLVGISACALRLGVLRATILLAVFLLVQIVDIQPIARHVNIVIAMGAAKELEGVPPGKYSRVMVYPPWQCDSKATPLGGRNYEAVGFFAAREDIPTNNFYAARTLPEQKVFHCDYDNLGMDVSPVGIYLLSRNLYERYGWLFKNDFSCASGRNGDSSWLCVPKAVSQ